MKSLLTLSAAARSAAGLLLKYTWNYGREVRGKVQNGQKLQ